MLRVPALGPSVPSRGNRFSRGLGRLGLRLLRWTIEGEIPNIPRCVIIVAPHTSNWDFVVGYFAKLALGLKVNFLAKHTLFRGLFGVFLRWAGGISVDRTEAGGVVRGAVSLFQRPGPLFLVVTPEGTRKKVERWKSGFYRIAQGASLPIFPIAFDYSVRAVRLNPPFTPTGDYDVDLAALQSYFSSRMAFYPDRY